MVVPLRVRGRTTGWITYRDGGFGAGGPSLPAGALQPARGRARQRAARAGGAPARGARRRGWRTRSPSATATAGSCSATTRRCGCSAPPRRRTSWGRRCRTSGGASRCTRPTAGRCADATCPGCARSRTSVRAPMLMRRVNRVTGEQQWLLTKSTVLHGGDGRPELVMNVTEDVTATTRAELGRRLLVEAGRLLSESDRLRGVAAGGRASWWCPSSRTGAGSTCPGPAGFVNLAAVAHVEPRKVQLARELRARRPLHIDEDGVATEVLRTGRTQRLVVDDAMLAEAVADEEQLGDDPRARPRPRRCRWRCAAATRSSGRSRSSPRRRTGASTSATRSWRRRSPAGSADALRNARLLRDRADDRPRALRGPASRPVAAAAGLRGGRRLPAGGGGRRGGRRLLRGGRRARRARS